MSVPPTRGSDRCPDPLSDAMREAQAFFEASGCPCAAANPEVLRAVVEERLLRVQRAAAERGMERATERATERAHPDQAQRAA